MDLTTHAVFAFAIGLVFFGHLDLALLVMLGALVPDLDREYWFVRTRKYQDEQPHRARFHNVFVMAGACLFSPFLALGVFLHALQDSFTTAKDRGAEWFYPLTRFINRGVLNGQGVQETDIQPGKIYFYQEDPQGIIEHADPDLQEPDDKPTPWRRTYGPALNSCLLDRGFLLGSAVVIFIWLLTPDLSHIAVLNHSISFFYPFIAAFAFFGFVYLSGELDRRDRKTPLKAIPKSMIMHKELLKKPIFVAGLVFLVAWFVLYSSHILSNLHLIFANWFAIAAGSVSIVVVAFVIVKYEIREGKKKGIPVVV